VSQPRSLAKLTRRAHPGRLIGTLGLFPTMFALLAFPGVAAAAVSVSATEGQSVTAKVADSGTCTLMSASITWGDGTPASAGQATPDGTGVQGTHTYVEEGTYDGSVKFTCSPAASPRQPFRRPCQTPS